jgi:hypothetical protein
MSEGDRAQPRSVPHRTRLSLLGEFRSSGAHTGALHLVWRASMESDRGLRCDRHNAHMFGQMRQTGRHHAPTGVVASARGDVAPFSKLVAAIIVRAPDLACGG